MRRILGLVLMVLVVFVLLKVFFAALHLGFMLALLLLVLWGANYLLGKRR